MSQLQRGDAKMLWPGGQGDTPDAVVTASGVLEQIRPGGDDRAKEVVRQAEIVAERVEVSDR